MLNLMLSLFRGDNHPKWIGLKGLAVKADAERSAKILDLGITQTIHAGVFKHAGNAAAPSFDDVHILERRADGNITHAGIAFDQMLNGQVRAQSAGGSDLQTVIIDRHLDGAGRQIGSVTYGVGDELTDAVHRQLVNVLPIDIRNAGAQVDVLFDEHHGVFDLLINRPSGFLPVQEYGARIPFENRHLDKSIREQRIYVTCKQFPGIGWEVFILEVHKDSPLYQLAGGYFF